MLRYRLPLGVGLVLGLIAAVSADEALSGRGAPGGLVVGPILVLLVVIVGRELSRILRGAGLHASWLGAAGYGVIGLGVMTLLRPLGAAPVVGGGAVLVLLCSVVSVARRRLTEGAVGAMAAGQFAFVYLGLMPGFLLLILQEFGGWALLAVLLTTKAYDIGAYFTGRWLGRRKLIEWLSPGKTWEGLVGGLVVSGGVGAGLVALGDLTQEAPGGAWWLGLIAGVAIGAVGQTGDLVASVLKRDAGVKDASGMMPGFGGFLDVFDSPLLVGPAAYWVLSWLSSG